MELITHSEAELPIVAQQLIEMTAHCKVVLLKAEMGVGKTTLVKAICKQLGVTDNVSSPTFSLVNEYANDKNRIYHFDLYRIKAAEELYDIGFEEYLDSGYLCLIEWPELASNLMPDDFILVKIVQKGTDRVFSLTHRK